MQKIRACLQKTPNALLCVLGAVVFLAGFYFLCYRTPLNEVWLPTTMNNDEALYNRQVVSVLTHGGPQGYFGYQESTADIGRYGTWGPLLIWAYALPGLLFGASVNVVLWCNLLLIAVGIAVFARCARLNYWQCIALCGALFSIMLPLRSCVSGASEAMHYMLALLIVGPAGAGKFFGGFYEQKREVMAVVRRGNFDRAVLPDGHLGCELYLRRHQECLRQGRI